MRTHPSRSFLAFSLAFLFAAAALLAPATALAARSTATTAAAFIAEQDCDQFLVGRDSNSFYHAKSNFPATYELDAAYQNVLFSMATQKEYNKLVAYMKKDWGGSCYGIAGTMVLNRLADQGYFGAAGGLRASMMQPGATKYFDITAPKNNRTALNYINFYMLSQFVSKSRENDAVTQMQLLRYNDGKCRYYNLDDTVQTFMDWVDLGLPVQCGYGYDGGGHAIVGVDYYTVYDRSGSPKFLYLKLYDENDRGSCVANKTKPHFCYIKLQFDANGDLVAPSTDSQGNERMYIYYYNYKKGKYIGKYINALRVRDMATIYNNLHSGGGTNASAATYAANGASSPATLTLSDVEQYYNAYFIQPFAYENGDPNTIVPAVSCGILYKPVAEEDSVLSINEELPPEDPPERFSYPPIPVDAGDTSLPFGNMVGFDTNAPSYRYETFSEGDGTDMEIDLLDRGVVEGGANRVYDGYDVITDGYLPGASLAKGEHYAWVSGNSIDHVRFSSDGRLRDVVSTDEESDVTVYFGTQNEGIDLDMLRFSMNDFGSLQVYDTEDNPEYRDCIVLRTDGLANGFDFTFYKNALESDTCEAAFVSEDADADGAIDDIWIMIKAFADPTNSKLNVKVWAAADPGGNDYPEFTDPPLIDTTLHERVFPQSGDGGSAAGTNATPDFNTYPLKSGTSGERLPDGSLRFIFDAPYENQTGASVDNKPLQKDVDYVATKSSTIITLKPAFLATLPDGAHTLTVYFTDGRAQTSFTTPLSGVVTAAVPDVPATGDTPLWAAWVTRLTSIFSFDK